MGAQASWLQAIADGSSPSVYAWPFWCHVDVPGTAPSRHQVLDDALEGQQGSPLRTDPCQISELVWPCFPPPLRPLLLCTSLRPNGHLRTPRDVCSLVQGGHHVLRHYS